MNDKPTKPALLVVQFGSPLTGMLSGVRNWLAGRGTVMVVQSEEAALKLLGNDAEGAEQIKGVLIDGRPFKLKKCKERIRLALAICEKIPTVIIGAAESDRKDWRELEIPTSTLTFRALIRRARLILEL